MEDLFFNSKNFMSCEQMDDKVIVSHGILRSKLNFGVTAHVTHASMCMCEMGTALLKINGVEKTLKRNDFFIFIPDSQASIESCSPNLDMSFISLSKHFGQRNIFPKEMSLVDLFMFISEQPVMSLSQTEALFFNKTRELLSMCLAYSNDKYREEIVYGFLSSLSMWIYGVISDKLENKSVIKSHKDILVTRFLAMVRDSFRQEHRLNFYANRLCVTTKYLSHAAKDVTGMSGFDWINYYIILEAKRLLTTTRKPISDVSMELGFPNQSFFGKYFKKYVGLNPTDFRYMP